MFAAYSDHLQYPTHYFHHHVDSVHTKNRKEKIRDREWEREMEREGKGKTSTALNDWQNHMTKEDAAHCRMLFFWSKSDIAASVICRRIILRQKSCGCEK